MWQGSSVVVCVSAFILLLSQVAGATYSHSKVCRDVSIPVTVTSINYIWGLPKLTNNFDVAALNTDLGRWDSNVSFHPISGGAPATATYKISGTICTPKYGGSGTLLLATHGFGFDRSYWNPTIHPEKYNFVDFAVAKGYSVFFYDRLSLGGSSVESGYVAQVSVQTKIIEQLVLQIRSGKVFPSPKKIILLGHSFGSVLSNALLVSNPGIVDGAVLTGIGYANPSTAVSVEAWQLRLARLQSPRRFRQLDGGYVTWVDIFANINTFFKAPFYDPAVVEYAEARKQPFSLMEAITIGLTNFVAPAFIGPVMVISGEFDFIFCTGYCPGILKPKALEKFPASKDLEVYVQPASGHAINFSLNATGAFEVITGFLSRNGL